jgi:hypothetical protein
MLLYCWFRYRQFGHRDHRCIDHHGWTTGFGFVQRSLRHLLWSLRYCVLDADAVMVNRGYRGWMVGWWLDDSGVAIVDWSWVIGSTMHGTDQLVDNIKPASI